MSSIPIGYLIPTLLVLLSVYFIVAPPSWPRPFKFWWVIAAVVNELPFFAALFLVVSTALAISEGDVYSPGGWIAFGFNVASAISLVVLFYLSLQTAPAIRRALTEGLGGDWSDRLDSKLVKRLDKNFSVKALLGPFFIRSASVQHIRNISYGNAGRYHTLDSTTKNPGPHAVRSLYTFTAARFELARKIMMPCQWYITLRSTAGYASVPTIACSHMSVSMNN